ncbi:MAG TPA: DUF3971 domain-containing protein, partial [Lysobacter sp.]|nr:DUF3971 domain-containing protein [Lysobacter sp.]
LTLERAADGRWQVRGLPGQQEAGSDPFSALEGLGELQVIGGKLAVIAPSLDLDAQIPKTHLRLRVDGDRVRVGVRAWPQLNAAPLDAVLDFDRKKGDGSAYAGAKQADLAAWTSLLKLQGIAVEGGTGRAEAWATLRGHRVASITIDAALDNVALRGAPIEPGAALPRSRFDHVETRARLRLVPGGWRADAPLLRIGRKGGEQKLDGLLVAGGEHYALQAKQIDAGPLFATLALSDKLQPALRRWLQASQPVATLRNIEVTGRRGGAVRARASVAALGFNAIGKSPGLHGLSGDIEGDGNGFTLRFDPRASVRFDWPTGFGVVHAVKLRGEVGGWREGAGWRVGTTALRIDGDNLGVNARGGLWWQGDGTRPWIDVAAEIDDTIIPIAKGFWLHENMSPKTVHWLDTALVAGNLQGGRAVVSGDLDDWPFRNNTGLFEATGHISDATIRFQEEWPAAQGIEVDARFSGIGFDVDGVGKLGAVGIDQIHAGIDDYRGGALTVQATGRGDAAELLAVLKQSPLQKEHADTFANIAASGAADVGFQFKLPLQKGAPTTINGSVALKNAKLSDARWKLAFDQVNGKAMYARGGFKAEALAVRHEGEPGKLSLRAGSEFVRDARHVFEAGLDASLGAVELIDRAEDLAWLKPYLGGRSNWTVGIAIPKSASGQDGGKSPPTLLQLSSNLIGTALDLPAPLRKSAAAPLAAKIETPLPLGSGDILVGLGDVMALRARSNKGQTGVRVVLGADRVVEAAPVSGLIAGGRAETLDAVDWIALTRGGDGGGKLSLQRIDVTAQRLQLLGATFPNTRVIVAPAARGAIAIQAEGAALQGAVLVPAGEGEALAGR